MILSKLNQDYGLENDYPTLWTKLRVAEAKKVNYFDFTIEEMEVWDILHELWQFRANREGRY